jgi:hypothetical protein
MAEEQWVILKADIEDVKSKLDQIAGKSTITANTMQTNWASVATSIASSLGIAFSLRALINFGKQSVSTFADIESSSMILANTLKNIGVSPSGIKSVEDLIKNLEQTKYFDLKEINEAFGNAAIKLRDVDIATKAVTTSMEIARARNIPLSDAVQRLTLGLMGNSRGLRDLGINIKDYKTTLDASGEASLDASTQLKILGDVMVTVGGATVTFGKTTKSGLAEATTAWQDFKAETGNILAPAVKGISWELSGFLKDATQSLMWFEETGKRVSQTHPLGNINQDAVDFEDTLKSRVYGGLQKVQTQAEDAGNAIKEAFKPAWATIKIEGLNVPELTKFVGNLSQVAKITPKAVPPIKIDIGGTVKIVNGKPDFNNTYITNVIQQGIAAGVKKGVEEGLSTVSHGAGWYSNRIGGP